MAYETIKKFLSEGGKCLLIENGKPVGVVLTMEEFEKISGGKINTPASSASETAEPFKFEPAVNPIGEAMLKEMNFPGASASAEEIDLADDITLEDLGIDELPY